MKRFITLGIVLLMTATGFAQQINPYPKTINVNGSAELEIIPDEIYVVVTLKEYEKKSSGKIELEKIKAAFLEKCRSIGLADSSVVIASYEGGFINPWLVKKRKKEDLLASIAYQVKFSSSRKIDELVNKLDDEATVNFQVTQVSHSKLPEFRKQLKIQAVKAAKEKAQYLAEAVGEQVGVAVSLSEFNEPPVVPYNMMSNTLSQYRMAEKGNMEDAGTDFKKIKLRMEIQATFALK